MNVRLLFAISAVLALGHGLGFILLPAQLLALYQIGGSPGAEFMGQLFGSQLIATAIIVWKARDFQSLDALSAVVLANLVANAVGTALSVRAVMINVSGPMGWLAVAIYGGLTIGYVLVYFKKGYASSAA